MCNLTSGYFREFLAYSFGLCVGLSTEVENTKGGTGVDFLLCVCVLFGVP